MMAIHEKYIAKKAGLGYNISMVFSINFFEGMWGNAP